MRAVVIGNGSINDYPKALKRVQSANFVICADGGQRHAERMGIVPDVVIGDFDSSEINKDMENIVYPTRKDATDSELAIDYAAEHGCDKIDLLALTGDRLDHTLTNIMMLSKYPDMRVLDDKNEIFMLKPKTEIVGYKGKTLSVVPLTNLEGVRTKGLEWELDNETLYFGSSRSNSNVVNEDRCEISVKNGVGIVVITDGE